MTIYESNFKNLLKLFKAPTGEYPKYMRFESEGFMRLTFDRVLIEPNRTVYAMSHRFRQEGDLIADPEMIIEIKGSTVESLSIQHAFGPVVPVYTDDRQKYWPDRKRDQNDFLKIWLRNINRQGFKRVE